jgi:two-component system NtrC family sensor kinase
VFVNLIINAQHALQEHHGERRLTLVTRVARAADQVEIEVADNGIGVPRDARRRIFEPFFSTKPQGAGTGLGLSYSHGVIEAHGGRLELAEAEVGATFLIALPTQAAAAPTAASADEEVQPRSEPVRGHALVVDDETEISQTLVELLERDGFRVLVANSGSQAKAHLARRDFDLILSDLRMPDGDGPSLHAWIRAERPHLLARLGFISGDTIAPTALAFLAESGCPSLEKPFSPAALRTFVAKVLEGA